MAPAEMPATPAPETSLEVSVVYATAAQQLEYPLVVVAGASLAQVVAAAMPALRQAFPAVEWDDPAVTLTLGVWGERVSSQALVHSGDRVEIYRQLPVDPKASRRSRADAAAQRLRRR